MCDYSVYTKGGMVHWEWRREYTLPPEAIFTDTPRSLILTELLYSTCFMTFMLRVV